MIGQVMQAMEVDWNVKKGPLSHQQMKCSFFDYISLLMIGWAIQVMKVNQSVIKGLLSHQQMKCSFLDYIQLFMIGWVIQVMKVDQNTKRPPKSSKNEMLIFGLCSTSDDQLSDPSNESQPRFKKWNALFWITFNFSWLAEQSKWWKSTKMWIKAPKVIKKWNAYFWIMFNFWWSAEWPKQWKLTKIKKKGPLSHQKIKCSFLDYIQLFMIGWVIQGLKVNRNVSQLGSSVVQSGSSVVQLFSLGLLLFSLGLLLVSLGLLLFS